MPTQGIGGREAWGKRRASPAEAFKTLLTLSLLRISMVNESIYAQKTGT